MTACIESKFNREPDHRVGKVATSHTKGTLGMVPGVRASVDAQDVRCGQHTRACATIGRNAGDYIRTTTIMYITTPTAHLRQAAALSAKLSGNHQYD